MIIFYASQFFTPVCTITFFLPIDLSHFITHLKKISRKFFECLTSIWLSLHLNVQVVFNLPTHQAVLTSLSCLSILPIIQITGFFLDRSTLKSSAEKSNRLRGRTTTLKITRRDGERRGQRKKQKRERLKCKKTLPCCSRGSRIWRTGATEGYERTAVTLRVQFHSSNEALEARGRGAGR